MTATSDAFKDIAPPLLHLSPSLAHLFTMFALAEILISFRGFSGRYRRTTSEEELQICRFRRDQVLEFESICLRRLSGRISVHTSLI
jgi:hypothetical protein